MGGPGAGGDEQRADPAGLMLSPMAAGEAGHCHLRSRLRLGRSMHRIPWELAVVGEAAGLESADSENKSRKPVPLDRLQEVDLVQTISMRDSWLPPTLPFFLALCSKYCYSPWLRAYNPSPFQTFQGIVLKLRSSRMPRKCFSV